MKVQVVALVKAQLAAPKKIQDQETKELVEIASVIYDLEKIQATIKPLGPKEHYHKLYAFRAAVKLNSILKKRRGSP